jgi:hypothetical protein
MEEANTQAYYNMATIMAVISFILLAPYPNPIKFFEVN